ncbi:hypothetical protein [Streptomyces sp. Wb2n-11]|uniref:hypothetical protein n=1 Tax=Streptomyces sp. Wb2n-11 TaxID=1030533 RepID=UPI0021000C3A|nr:hypothetical protein [Streptomyces sp. Wb2n-11]
MRSSALASRRLSADCAPPGRKTSTSSRQSWAAFSIQAWTASAPLARDLKNA